MSYKIQITVDEELNETIKANAMKMGLSVSSYARLALMSLLSRKKDKLLTQAIEDIHSNNLEALTLAKFNRQLNNL